MEREPFLPAFDRQILNSRTLSQSEEIGCASHSIFACGMKFNFFPICPFGTGFGGSSDRPSTLHADGMRVRPIRVI